MKTYQKALIVLSLGACAAWLWSESLAQNAAAPQARPTTVGVCDIVQVFNNNQKSRDLQAKLEERKAEIEAENQQRARAIEATRAELNAYKEGSPQYEKTLDEVQRQTIERTVWLEYQNRLAVREHKRLTEQMYQEIQDVIAEIARSRGIDLVLYSEGELIDTEDTRQLFSMIERRKVLYAADRIDLTADVLTRLNELYAAGELGS